MTSAPAASPMGRLYQMEKLAATIGRETRAQSLVVLFDHLCKAFSLK